MKYYPSWFRPNTPPERPKEPQKNIQEIFQCWSPMETKLFIEYTHVQFYLSDSPSSCFIEFSRMVPNKNYQKDEIRYFKDLKIYEERYSQWTTLKKQWEKEQEKRELAQIEKELSSVREQLKRKVDSKRKGK